MARYIDADAFKEYLRKGTEANADIIPQQLVDAVLDIMDGIMIDIDEQPTVDAVPVVRCKDCKHWDEHSQYGYDSENGVYGNYCMLWTPDDDFYAVETPEDGFCYEGERKDDE